MAFTKVTSTLADTLNQNTTGSAATLTTARTIGGTSFDGSANIAVATATEATNITAVANNSADETVYPTFVDGATGTQGLETDTGFTYNPSSGDLTTAGQLGGATLSLSGNATVGGNLTVTGTSTVVNTVTMNAQNAIVFEGATADNYETTLSIVDPTADHTQYLINQGGYIPVLAAVSTTAISATPAELNLLDGSTANSVVNSKAVVYGSSGELAGTLSTAAQTNVTSLGTLTTLTVDNVIINGTTIGHTGDTDLLTFASGALTVAGTTTIDVSSAAALILNSTADTPYMRFDHSDASKFTIGESSIVGGGGAGYYDFYAVSGIGQRFFTAAAERIRIGTAGQIGIGGANYGSDGQVLTSAGSGATVAWESLPAGGPTFKTFGTGSIMVGDDATGTINAANYNTGLGIDVFASLTTGDENIAIGYRALDGGNPSYNIAIGNNALGAAATGSSNVAIGTGASGANTSGTFNVSVGHDAAASNETGTDNTAIGYLAMNANTNNANTAVGSKAGWKLTGEGNTFIGKDAAENATSCDYSVVIGNQANGTGVMTGNNNVLIGSSTGAAHTSAHSNVAVGAQALGTTTSQHSNTAIGYRAGSSNTGGSNTLVGKDAGHGSLTGDSNTYLGTEAGMGTTSGYGNVAVGKDTGRGITTGFWNTYLGSNCATTGNSSYNVGIGNQVLETGAHGGGTVAIGWSVGEDLTGSSNTLVGAEAGRQTTSSDDCVAIGWGAMGTAVTTGNDNVCVGKQAHEDITSGTYNTSIGNYSGKNFSTGYRNTCLGWSAGNVWPPANQTNGYGVYLGMETKPGAVNSTYEVVIGTEAVGKGSNTGFMNANSGGNYAGNNSSSWSTTSDRRIKKNIEDNNIGLEALTQIRVRNFEYRTEDEIVDFDNPKAAVVEREGLQLGVIAQEIEEILPDVVTTLDSGVKSVDPDNLTWYLVNAVKELSAKVEALENS